MKGVLHVHSTYSDGEFTLAELREIFIAAGCGFACVTDHADWFRAESLAAYVHETRALSDERFHFVAGLEFPCHERMHIVGYGATALTDAMEPADVIRHIEACGGVSVIAHPKDVHFDWIGNLDAVADGLEVWNSKYDGRYAPRPGTFALLRQLQARRPDVRAFYGQDLHWRTQYRGLTVNVEVDEVSDATILAALRAGRFHGEKDGVQLPSTGVLPESILQTMGRAHRRSQQLRAWLKSAKRFADRLGLRVPARLKAQARRVM